jgi:hypothetical protein
VAANSPPSHHVRSSTQVARLFSTTGSSVSMPTKPASAISAARVPMEAP